MLDWPGRNGKLKLFEEKATSQNTCSLKSVASPDDSFKTHTPETADVLFKSWAASEQLSFFRSPLGPCSAAYISQRELLQQGCVL